MGKTINISPEEFAEKHARRLKAAIPDMQAGIERVAEAPTLKAASKQEKMLANVSAAVQSGKWAAGLKRVSLDDWKKAFKEKGLQRVSAGIDGARDKVISFASQLLPYQQNLKNEVDRLPDLTLEDSINRAITWIRGMSKFQRK